MLLVESSFGVNNALKSASLLCPAPHGTNTPTLQICQMTRGKKCSLAAILVIMVAYGRYRYTAAIGPSPASRSTQQQSQSAAFFSLHEQPRHPEIAEHKQKDITKPGRHTGAPYSMSGNDQIIKWYLYILVVEMVVYKMTFLFSSQSENCGVMLSDPSSLFRLSVRQ